MTNENDMMCQLLEHAERLAVQQADGHVTIMRFTTGWKVMLGTPEMTAEFTGENFEITGGGYGDVQKITAFKSLQEALESIAR